MSCCPTPFESQRHSSKPAGLSRRFHSCALGCVFQPCISRNTPRDSEICPLPKLSNVVSPPAPLTTFIGHTTPPTPSFQVPEYATGTQINIHPYITHPYIQVPPCSAGDVEAIINSVKWQLQNKLDFVRCRDVRTEWKASASVSVPVFVPVPVPVPVSVSVSVSVLQKRRDITIAAIL